jgi:hypothetical protein
MMRLGQVAELIHLQAAAPQQRAVRRPSLGSRTGLAPGLGSRVSSHAVLEASALASLLYYTILYYAMLCYASLYYTILYYTILYYTILYYTILYYTILCYAMLALDEVTCV